MQPQVIEDSIAVTTAGNDNVLLSNNSLAGNIRAQFAGQMVLLATQSATGLRLTLNHGATNSVMDSDVRVGTDLQAPYDVINGEGYVQEGEQIALKVTNGSGGTLTLRYRIIIVPLAPPGSGIVQLPPEAKVMVRGPSAITTGTNDSQLLAGLLYETVQVPSLLEIFMTASATGMTRQIYIDSARIAPPSSIAPLNRIPQDPLDSIIEGIEVMPNRKIQLMVTNNSGGTLNAFWKIKLKELQL